MSLEAVCPFCSRDPYQYVDNGIARIPVAVVCCVRASTQYYEQHVLMEAHEARVQKVRKVLSLKKPGTADQCDTDDTE